MATARELAIRHPKLKLAVLEKEYRLGIGYLWMSMLGICAEIYCVIS